MYITVKQASVVIFPCSVKGFENGLGKNLEEHYLIVMIVPCPILLTGVVEVSPQLFGVIHF